MHTAPRVVYSRLFGNPQPAEDFVETHVLSVAAFCYRLFYAISQDERYRGLSTELVDCIVDLTSSMESSVKYWGHPAKGVSVHRQWVAQRYDYRTGSILNIYERGCQRYLDHVLYNGDVIGQLQYPRYRLQGVGSTNSAVRSILGTQRIGEQPHFCIETQLQLFDGLAEWGVLCTEHAVEHANCADTFVQRFVDAARNGYVARREPSVHYDGPFTGFRKPFERNCITPQKQSMRSEFLETVSTLFLGAVFGPSEKLGSMIRWMIRTDPFQLSFSTVISSTNNDRYLRLHHAHHEPTTRFLDWPTPVNRMSNWVAMTAALTSVSTTNYFSFGMMVKGRKRRLWVTVDRINTERVLAICRFRRNGYCHIMYSEQFVGCQLVPLDAMVYMPSEECDVEFRDLIFSPSFYPVQRKMITM